MRWLKRLISTGLLIAAVAIALATAFSGHKDDYGKVPLPQGGIVHLPKGEVVVYYSRLANGSDSAQQVNVPFAFQVAPVGGGAPVPISAVGGGTSADATQQSETIGEVGAVSKLDVASAGDYVVTVSGDLTPGTSTLEFGTNAGSAVLARWRLFAGLVIAAILIALIPVPRQKKRWEDESGAPTGWSSDPRAPYAG